MIFRLQLFFFVVFLSTINACTQTNTSVIENKTSKKPIAQKQLIPAIKLCEYEQVMVDSGLVDIHKLDSTIRIDLKYSTTDNFLHTDVYGELTNCYLRKAAAEKLVKAQKILRRKKPGYSLIVFDGARPRRVQYIMWEILDIPNKIDYLADPSKGSVHNYGMAVDLSIVDEKGKELDMGTPFDFFGILARPDSEDSLVALKQLTSKHIQNRWLLRSSMTEAGFQPIKTEWWHFTAIPSTEVGKYYRMIE